jgi:predicted nucleic acid-binding Zn ribbon protein
MTIKSVNETVTQVTADNVIFETSGMYVTDSVSVKYVINGSEVPILGAVAS